MKTTFITEEKYAEKFLKLAENLCCTGDVRPLRFQKIMRENRGAIEMFSPFPQTGDGLERKNPLVVALGDSVTAGHFESVMAPLDLKERLENGGLKPDESAEIVDVLESYVDRFRRKLVEKYEITSVSVVNSGIAGDTILGMEKRLDRDVIRYQPDLVLINASLNWPPECGGNDVYEKTLKAVVTRVKEETRADIVLMTPNVSLPTPFDNPDSTLMDRVKIIRKLSKELKVSLVDMYLVWEAYIKDGNPAKALLANGANHPSMAGHEGYAIALMQLFK